MRNRSERGFSLVMVGVCATVMVGMLGLTTDLGRVYIAKNELQTFADAASMAAVLKLNGKQTGLDAANSTGQSGPIGIGNSTNLWNMASQSVAGATVTCATLLNDAFQPCTSGPLTSRFVRVLVSSTVPMYFIGIVPGVSNAMTVNAQATSGLALKSALGAGGAPFSPPARNSADLNFGWTVGQIYTLKWGTKESTCGTDASLGDKPLGSPDRGIVDLGQGNGASGLGDLIVDGRDYSSNWPHPDGYHVGDEVPWVEGSKTGPVDKSMESRFEQDTNQTEPLTYAQYQASLTGNGRRLLVVPVNDELERIINGVPDDSYAHIVGFALFFLQTKDFGNKKQVCGEYVGPASFTMNPGPATAPQNFYAPQLFQ